MQSQVRELGKSMATMKEYIERDLAKKEEKTRKKAEKNEAEIREAEEREAKARKARKKAEKARSEEERLTAMKKDMDMHVRITVKAVMKESCSEIRDVLLSTKGEPSWKGKKKVTYQSDEGEFSDYEVVSSDTEDIRVGTWNLCINEKRKRGVEPVFEDSPRMELQPKRTKRRTPRRVTAKPPTFTPRVTRSKTKTKKKVAISPNTKERFVAAIKRNTPAKIGILKRYMFQEHCMKQLKDLDAITLQNICNEEGIPYGGKIDAMFDLAEHRTYKEYGTDEEDEARDEEAKEPEEEGVGEVIDEEVEDDQ
ncbi:hypothetical protein CBR_g32292 [Chara braunii]|uniref:Uncharacterized protein n=1 Tax=Chara braunii TaxID=69332 RepID=A0A388JNB4_CHABU|nr:hypothetical protein CBR_g32292 [Chara braunii]|eukprot:GBG59277.1 hypothetical protein CBR_g32292 [Chara braunii]